MNRIAQFQKVDFEQYLKDRKPITDAEHEMSADKFQNYIRDEYDAIQLPQRSTSGSAGYDFRIPHDIMFRPGNNVFFGTGIRCCIEDGWFLNIVPKSGLGTKYGTRLLNTIGVVDADYYLADNGGHIMCGMTVKRDLELKAGDKFAQGIFIPHGITYDDNADGTRTGGFGSTGR